MEKITSVSNPRVQRVVQLKDKAKAREKAQAFIAEGLRLVSDTAPERLLEVYATESFLAEHPMDGAVAVSDEVMRKMSDTRTPQGVLAVVRMPEHDEEKLIAGTPGKPPLFLLLEDIRDPGNLGTILRTAEAAGVTAVFMSPGTVDVFSPKVVRSTMSAIFRVPFVPGADLLSAAERMKERGVRVYASYLDPGAVPYTDADLAGGAAIMVGNEAAGLTAELSGRADSRVYIPMQGEIESLNAAMAAGILMYEAARQRREARNG